MAQGFETGVGSRLDLDDLITIIDNATTSAQTKISNIKEQSSAVSIGDMFEMQILMNHLSQLSEMSTAVMAASHSAIKTMAQNVRG